MIKMFLILDTSSVVFWTITYLLILVCGIRYRKEYSQMIPMLAALLSLGWEINAIIVTNGFYGHIIWATLDIGILVLNCGIIRHRGESQKKYLVIAVAILVIEAIIFYLPSGMLISSFVIDCIIAAEYALAARRYSLHMRSLIAVARTIGDASAWIAYFNYTPVVAVIGAAVLILNLFYLGYCITHRGTNT